MPSTADDAAASADRLEAGEVVDEWDEDEEYADDDLVDGDDETAYEQYGEDEYAEDEEYAQGQYADGERSEQDVEAEYAEDEDVEYEDEEYEDDADWDGAEEDAPAPRRGIAALVADGLSRFRRRHGSTEDTTTTDPYAEESFDAAAETAYVDDDGPRESDGAGSARVDDSDDDWEHEDAADGDWDDEGSEPEDAADENWDDEEDLGDGPHAASADIDGTHARGRVAAGGSTAVAPRGGARRAPRSPALGTVVRRPRLPQTRRVTSPRLHPVAGAAAAGLLTGLVGVVLTLLTMSGCAALLGTPSCGGGLGFVGLVVVITVTVLAGRTMMRFLSVPDAAAIAFVGVVTVVVLLLLLAPDSLFSVWMWVVAPLLAAATFAATCALTLSAENSPERR